MALRGDLKEATCMSCGMQAKKHTKQHTRVWGVRVNTWADANSPGP
eukprot:CAMPEP_0175604516 /NCGR_PEP_ID=MMETSP0096-20121207/59711_1 /TAXON_ID=311494 /ORGANISM="Alexandrium monilatum, Strain CCMP3105" /LENGTH=45 /DNA_ID= /DNA_START= /DNA_END= /DNA_ORIENTATION=